MNSVCVLTIASFGGAANSFSPRSPTSSSSSPCLIVSFQLFEWRASFSPLYCVLLDSLRHFFALHVFFLFLVNFQGRNFCGRAHVFFFTLCVNFQIQFDSLAFQLTLNAMKTKQTVERTLIISTSKTLRLVVAVPNTRRGSFFDDSFCFPVLQRFAFLTQKHSSSSSLPTCLLLNMIFCSFVFFFVSCLLF